MCTQKELFDLAMRKKDIVKEVNELTVSEKSIKLRLNQTQNKIIILTNQLTDINREINTQKETIISTYMDLVDKYISLDLWDGNNLPDVNIMEDKVTSFNKTAVIKNETLPKPKYSLRMLRIVHKLTQKDFGKLFGLNSCDISNMENWKNPNMLKQKKQEIAEHFNIDNDQLITDYFEAKELCNN